MENLYKVTLICGSISSIIGLFPVVGLYPDKHWENPTVYLNYVLSFDNELLWKIGLIILIIGMIQAILVKASNCKKIIIFNTLALVASFASAYIGINNLMLSSSVIMLPIWVGLFIGGIFFSINSKTT